MKVATVLFFVAVAVALTGCPENAGSGDAKPAGSGTAAAGTGAAKPAAPASSGTGGW